MKAYDTKKSHYRLALDIYKWKLQKRFDNQSHSERHAPNLVGLYKVVKAICFPLQKNLFGYTDCAINRSCQNQHTKGVRKSFFLPPLYSFHS